ncbi:MAG: hypothetical protein ACTSU2_04240 [Promethearchaeota archaeon]
MLLKRIRDSNIEIYDYEKLIKLLLEEVYRKKKSFEYWKKKILFSYSAYKQRESKKSDRKCENEGYAGVYSSDNSSEDSKLEGTILKGTVKEGQKRSQEGTTFNDSGVLFNPNGNKERNKAHHGRDNKDKAGSSDSNSDMDLKKINNNIFNKDKIRIGYFFKDDKDIRFNRALKLKQLDLIIPSEEPFRISKYFMKKFRDIFEFYFVVLFPFKRANLKRPNFNQTRHLDDVYSLYYYEFSLEEIQSFLNFKKQMRVREYLGTIIEIFFKAIIHVLSILMTDIIKDENFKIELIVSKLEYGKNQKFLEYLKDEEFFEMENLNNLEFDDEMFNLIKQKRQPKLEDIIDDNRKKINDYNEFNRDIKQDNLDNKISNNIGNAGAEDEEIRLTGIKEGDNTNENNNDDNSTLKEKLDNLSKMDMPRIKMIINIRQNETVLKEFYFSYDLYSFVEKFPQIPLRLKMRLKAERNLLYLLALRRYYTIRPYIMKTLIKIKIKSIALNQISPFFDILNFILSRVEDSIYTPKELITQFLKNTLKISPAKIDIVLDLIKYCDEHSSLYSTFQSNNKPQMKDQFILFILYMQHFFNDGISGAISKNIFSNIEIFENEYKELKDEYNNEKLIGFYEELFMLLIKNLFSFYLTPYSEVFFNNFLGYSFRELNEEFFKSLLYSVDYQFIRKIKSLNQKYSTDLNFNEFIDILVKLLYYLINQIFIRDNPSDASKNFNDTQGRYYPKQIVLRTLEILMFKEIQLPDNNWEYYNISNKQDKIINLFKDYLIIPKDYFFSNRNLLYISILYQGRLATDLLLEQWFVAKIIKPFFTLIHKITVNLSQHIKEDNITIAPDITDNKELKQKILNNIENNLYETLTKNIIDEETKDKIEYNVKSLMNIFGQFYLKHLDILQEFS